MIACEQRGLVVHSLLQRGNLGLALEPFPFEPFLFEPSNQTSLLASVKSFFESTREFRSAARDRFEAHCLDEQTLRTLHRIDEGSNA